MRKFLLILTFVLAPVTALHAMTVSTFLQKADALEKRGVTAIFSSDLRLLKGEIRSAGESLRAERLAAQRAGRRTAYCPPERQSLTAQEILAHFRAIPVAQRGRMEVRDAMLGLMVRKYPCPA